MRRSPIHDVLAREGARFADRDGFECAASFSDEATEYGHVRNAVGVTDFSHMLKYRGRVDDAIFALDEVLAGNVANLRYGRILHTFLADGGGFLKADVYVACSDDEVLVLCETCAPAAEVDALMRGAGSPLEDVTDSFAVFSIDGPQAWAVLRDLFGRDILGLPYLSIDDQDLDATKVRLMRAGKTSEFGYLLAVPAEEAAKVWGRVREAGASQCAGLCGLDVFDLLKLDGRFFNVNREGRRVRDPLPLGLQWMIDFQKERFCGRDAILARREAGVPSKILGVGLRDGARGMSAGDGVELDGDRVGEVVTCGFSGTLRREIGLALVDVSVAYSGLDIVVRGAEGALPARSISMPPFVPRSLLVKLGDV